MKLRSPLAAALAAVLLGAVPSRPALTVYSAPAGDRPAGASRLEPADAILPDGRTAAPAERAVFVGTNPLGVTLTPHGRFAIVTNDNQDPASAGAPPAIAPYVRAGYSLSVVRTGSMQLASIYAAPGLALFCGLAALRDPAHPSRTIVLASDGANNLVRVFDLDARGVLAPEASVAVPGFPARITLSPNRRIAYVTSNLGDTVSAIDIAQRKLLSTVRVGFSPFGVARAGRRLLVANDGLEAYHRLSRPRRVPRFASVRGNLYRSSSLSLVPLTATGNLAAAQPSVVRMDPIPNGVENVGGAHPGSVVVRRDGRYAYVTLANVDRVATVALGGIPHVVSGLDIRLFVNAPYGTQPDAEVLSRDGKRLYVALAGLNAVAVLDASHPPLLHRLGLIPTGDFPSALALSQNGRFLYITSARGVDGWGLLQRVDVGKMRPAALVKATLSALRYNRAVSVAKRNAAVPPLRSLQKSTMIDHVVCIQVGSTTFDALFGDLGIRDGDPALEQFGASITPNLHALARQYGVAANFYLDGATSDINLQYALAGIVTAHVARTMYVNAGRAPFDAHGEDPEDYPRAGYLFDSLQRAQLSFRDYGGLLALSGYEPFTRPPVDTRSLGGLYTLDVPALAALDGHVDERYPGWNPQIDNRTRAAEFVRDMGPRIAADREPAFTYIWLPTAGTAASLSDADRALGTIVAFLSRTPHWSSTAIFVVADGIAGADHVNRARSYALVISPLAKQGYVGRRHLSTASVVKTEEELLGLPPSSLGDLLASDMADFFGDVPYPKTYRALP